MLTCFLMGTNAEVMEALTDDAARINQALADLDVAFGGAATTAFIEGVVQNWTAEPYVLGSYSYPAPGTRPTTGNTKRQDLAQPVGATLYFAGEATHNTAASTVPGAMQSGQRAGGEVDTQFGGPPAPGTPTADFSASIVSGPAPLDVSFSDLSTELPTGWTWDFGDTGSSNAQHPSHQYATPGTYPREPQRNESQWIAYPSSAGSHHGSRAVFPRDAGEAASRVRCCSGFAEALAVAPRMTAPL